MNNSLSAKFNSGLAGVLSPITDVLGAVLPYAATAFRVVNLIGSFFGEKPKENSLPPLPYGKDFGLIEYDLHGTKYTFAADLVISEEHKRSSQVCTHPIEDGTEIADYVLVSPKTITAVLLLSNYSIRRAGDAYVGNERHAEESYEILETVQTEKCKCNFMSSITKYRDYVIEELDFTRDKDSGNAIKVSLTFREIKVAKSETVIVDVLVGVSGKDINMSILGGTANTGAISIGGF